MEDPVNEIGGILRSILQRPTFAQQTAALKKVFTEDAEFYHPYVSLRSGLAAIVTIYNYVLLFVNYQDVFVRDIVYDPLRNSLVVRLSVPTKPWVLLWRTVTLQLLAQFELEDVYDEDSGKYLKKIKVQRDYFIRSPLVQAIPIIGDIYDSEKLRIWLGILTFTAWQIVIALYLKYVPQSVKDTLFDFWRKHLQIPVTEQLHVKERAKIKD